MLDQQLASITLSIMGELDTARSLTVAILVRYKQWGDLVRLRVEPRQYLDTVSGQRKFARDVQATDLLRKYEGKIDGISPSLEAYKSFWKTEAHCADVNLQLAKLFSNYGLTPVGGRVRALFELAAENIEKWLGKVPDHLDASRFGPGTTYEWKQVGCDRPPTIGDKIATQPHCTKAALSIVEGLVYSHPWGRAVLTLDKSSPVVVRGNRFTTVPKTALTDRPICIEPGANVYLQLGVGAVIRRRLAKIGIDLNNGQHHHRELARVGSLRKTFSTIDLSSASDTVAYNLVRGLLPQPWFELLDCLRSAFTEIADFPDQPNGGTSWVKLEKFSSMGNGFTFELETLIFVALIQAATGLKPGSQFWVYGDDIIVPTENSSEALSILRVAGFLPNPSKTFVDGPFRESCGGDFFEGLACRPYYIKEEINGPTGYMSLYNGLVRSGQQLGCAFTRTRRMVIQALPAPCRLFGPIRLGDAVLHGPRWVVREVFGRDYVRAVLPVFGKGLRLSTFASEVQLAATDRKSVV